VILAIFAVIAGFFNLPFSFAGGHWLSDFLGQHAAEFNPVVAGLALLIAAGGIAAGWSYGNAFQTAHDKDPLQTWQPRLFAVLNNKYYIDEIYRATIGQLASGLAYAWEWIDRNVLDRIVTGVGHVTFFLGRLNFIVDDTLFNDGPDSLADGTVTGGKGVRQVQTGKAQDYLGLIFLGVVLLGVMYLYGIQQ
jgi:NADH-quinone oxidoreductase subunit L